MANFNLYVNKVLAAEGGYQNYPSDTGNYNSLGQNVGTNYGIAAKTYESWIKRVPSANDMRAITPTIATAIYKAWYWDKIQGDRINSQPLAEILFDGYVNTGNYSVKLLQKILGVVADGVIGNITVSAINSKNSSTLYNAYKQARIEYYKYLGGASDIAQDWFNYFSQLGLSRQYDEFLDGWLNRMATFPDLADTAKKGGLFLLVLCIAGITYYNLK